MREMDEGLCICSECATGRKAKVMPSCQCACFETDRTKKKSANNGSTDIKRLILKDGDTEKCR